MRFIFNMMIKTFFSICIVLCLSFAASAQTAVVEGTARGAEGKKIFIKTYADFISNKEKVIARGSIDSAGKFQLKVPVREITFAWINIEYYNGEIYLQPGTTHRFNLKGLKFTEETDRINTNLEPLSVNVQVEDTGDLINISIQRLNIICNRFLINHVTDIQEGKIRKYLDTLSMRLDSVFRKVEIRYFRDYLRYRMASLEFTCNGTGTDRLFEQYLFHQPVLFNNIEYMSFFSQFFEGYFNEIDRRVNMSVLRRTVNEDRSYPAMLDSLGRDTLLRNEVLREAAMLVTLKNLYYTPGYRRENIIGILNQMSSKSKFEMHREIASDLIEMFTRFDPGRPAPEFTLLSSNEDTVRLKDYKGKFVYIMFFTTWNVACLDEMELMRKLYTKYSQSIHFIGICCDREFMKLYHFARDNKYPWTLLHFNNDYALLESYGVKTYPYFVLIDKQGCILADPAGSPSQNIEEELNKIIQNSGKQ